jgi:hypothetical protein
MLVAAKLLHFPSFVLAEIIKTSIITILTLALISIKQKLTLALIILLC